MTIKWHELTTACINDGMKLTLIELLANAKGELKFEYICLACGQKYVCLSDPQQIMERCQVLDETEGKGKVH